MRYFAEKKLSIDQKDRQESHCLTKDFICGLSNILILQFEVFSLTSRKLELSHHRSATVHKKAESLSDHPCCTPVRA
jgi:hypothetical protein